MGILDPYPRLDIHDLLGVRSRIQRGSQFFEPGGTLGRHAIGRLRDRGIARCEVAVPPEVVAGSALIRRPPWSQFRQSDTVGLPATGRGAPERAPARTFRTHPTASYPRP